MTPEPKIIAAAEKAKANIQAAMDALESMPMGAVGEGYTLEDMHEFEERGEVIALDANYHQALKAYLYLRAALEDLA